jgi:hypothetical protein
MYGITFKYQTKIIIIFISISMIGILFPNFQYAFHSLVSLYFTLGYANDNIVYAYALSTGGLDVKIQFWGPKYEGYYIAIDVIPAIVLILYFFLPSHPKASTV